MESNSTAVSKDEKGTSYILELHNAVKSGDKDKIVELLSSNRSIAFETNKHGDTPLHVAARLGNFEAVKLLVHQKYCGERKSQDLLVDCETGEVKDILKWTNNEKCTAFHEAVKRGYSEIITFLIGKDSSLVYLTTKDGESPLFLAIDRALYGIADCILRVVDYEKGLSQNIVSWSGRNGLTVMHAAVIRSHGRYVEKLLEKYDGDLLEMKDVHGWTPLHYAAHFGDVEVVKRFLQKKATLALIQDNEGMSPLHISARNGSFGVVKSLIAESGKYSYNICELLDNNDRTTLHVAVESRNISLVIRMLHFKEFNDILHWKDKDGNTCFHLAVLTRSGIMTSAFLFSLRVLDQVAILNRSGTMTSSFLLSRRVLDKFALNSKGMTATDIVRDENFNRMMDLTKLVLMIKQGGCLPSLESVHAKKSSKEKLVFELEQGHDDNKQHIGRKVPFISDIANVNLIVATIVASITFASVIQVPGGYNDHGIANLNGNSSFKLFSVFNSLAFGFSAASIFISFLSVLHYHIGMAIERLSYRPIFLGLAILLTQASLGSSVIAYIMSTKATLLDTTSSPWKFACSAFVVPVACTLVHLYISYAWKLI
ncbi:uncharacterized protein LOC133783677 [Humulus lupulus]|uniref:uncharacterized protein LOC133783677 n=1 Tax=Humulus lupulus TaxID=3486 RepID=UPI002B40F66D|nr:uncharacterized protein LOC133783677 [Humulus lupulus]